MAAKRWKTCFKVLRLPAEPDEPPERASGASGSRAPRQPSVFPNVPKWGVSKCRSVVYTMKVWVVSICVNHVFLFFHQIPWRTSEFPSHFLVFDQIQWICYPFKVRPSAYSSGNLSTGGISARPSAYSGKAPEPYIFSWDWTGRGWKMLATPRWKLFGHFWSTYWPVQPKVLGTNADTKAL